jgi:hypothetical protein
MKPDNEFAHTLNVQARLAQLHTWHEAWEVQTDLLDQKIAALDLDRPGMMVRGAQLARWQQRLRRTLIRTPLFIAPEVVQAQGYDAIRQQLYSQFAMLSRADRLWWLHNFMFLLTPDLRRLDEKVGRVRKFRSFGQQRNFLLGGVSGMGKSTFLDWYTIRQQPSVKAESNHIPVVKIDAPVSNRSAKALFHRMILECGAMYFGRDTEEELLMKLSLYFSKCRVELLIVDEVEHIQNPELRRRLLEVSNLTHGIPIICASCQPLHWITGDAEIAGRWNDYFELAPYTGERLQQLLAFIELCLPFSAPSHLAQFMTKTDKGDTVDGVARQIERWTGGVLRDIMILVMDASTRAIEQGESNLSLEILTSAWRDIQTQPTADFLDVLKRSQRRIVP